MKYFAMFLMLVSLGLFAVGCQKPVEAPPETTVEAPEEGEVIGVEEVDIVEEPAEEPTPDEPAEG